MNELFNEGSVFCEQILAGNYEKIVELTHYPAIGFFKGHRFFAHNQHDSIAQLSAHREALLDAGVERIGTEILDVQGGEDQGRMRLTLTTTHFDHAEAVLGQSHIRLYGESAQDRFGFSMIEIMQLAIPSAIHKLMATANFKQTPVPMSLRPN